MDGLLKAMLRRIIYIFAILLILVLTMLNANFFSLRSLVNILNQIIPLMIVSLGVGIAIIGGVIDISVGIIMVFGGSLGVVLQPVLGTGLAVIVGMSSGLVVGFLQGVISTRLRIHSIIVTLGFMTIFKGVNNVITKGASIISENAAYNGLSNDPAFLSLPFAFYMMLIFIAGAAFYLHNTKLGKNIYAIGGNESIAKISGIRVNTYKTAMFMISGFCATTAGVLLTSRLQGVAASVLGNDTALIAFTIVILGGCSVFGGKGDILGIVGGTLFLGVLTSGMTYTKMLPHFQILIRGLLFLTVITIDSLMNIRRKASILQKSIGLKRQGAEGAS